MGENWTKATLKINLKRNAKEMMKKKKQEENYFVKNKIHFFLHKQTRISQIKETSDMLNKTDRVFFQNFLCKNYKLYMFSTLHLVLRQNRRGLCYHHANNKREKDEVNKK